MIFMGIVEAFNNTMKAAFKISDWVKGRAKRKLEKRREELERQSVIVQQQGDVDALQYIRAEIEEVDRDIDAINEPKS
jgi:hypothetical protein